MSAPEVGDSGDHPEHGGRSGYASGHNVHATVISRLSSLLSGEITSEKIPNRLWRESKFSTHLLTIMELNLPLGAYLVLCYLTAFVGCGGMSGPFYIQLLEIRSCDDSGTEDIRFHTTRLNRVDKDHIEYNTNITLNFPMDDTVKAKMVLYAYGNGAPKEVFSYDSSYLCKDIETLLPEFYAILSEYTGSTTCPIPAGTHKIAAKSLKFEKVKLAQFPYGKYNVVTTFLKDEKNVGCFGLMAEVRPKPKVKKSGR